MALPLPRRATTTAPGALGFKDKARTKPLQPSTSSALRPPFPVLHGHLAHSKAILEAAVHLILSKALPGSSDGHQWKASLRTKALLWASPPSSPSALTPRPRASYESCISSPGCCSQRRQLLPKRVGTARGRRQRVEDSSWEWGQEAGGSRS